MEGNIIDYKEEVERGFTYEEYMGVVQEASRGHVLGDAMSHYSQMNFRRMQRWDKNLNLDNETIELYSSLNKTITFFIITEPWCGDAAHVLPVIKKIAEISPLYEIKMVNRDENPNIMDQYLVDGNRSIPIVVVLEKVEDLYLEHFSWGPKPAPLMKKVKDFKSSSKQKDRDAFLKEVQMWYNTDKSSTIQKEFRTLANKYLKA